MTPQDQCQHILDRIPTVAPEGRRYVVAIAGPPAAGKSTVASALVDALDGRAGLVGIDGFHYDNALLEQRGHRSRKGAPHTFDAASFGMTLAALRADRWFEMAVPVFRP